MKKIAVILLLTGAIFAVGAISIPTITHNTLDGLQGGQSGQYYHLTEANYTSVLTSISNWDSAYGWGDHSGAGYAVSGGAEHDGFSDYVAAEHINWTNSTANFLTTGTLGVGSFIGNPTGIATNDFIFGSTQTGDAGTALKDARMFFDKSRGAFRAGMVSSTQWDDDNVGDYSTAVGWNTIASAYACVAMGYNTTAEADFSIAMGSSTVASGETSVAMGRHTKAESYVSVALGRYNVGGGTVNSWVATDPLLEIGIGTADDARANALTVFKNGNFDFHSGNFLTTGTLGVGSFIGNPTGIATNDFIFGSTQTGDAGTALKDARMFFDKSRGAFRAGMVSSTQWDDDNVGDYSTAVGWNTIASAYACVAMGYNTTAEADFSIAMGSSTVASGETSVAMGRHTKAESYVSVALGRYNVGGGTVNSWVATDPLLEIGIGTADDARANALTVFKNGNFDFHSGNFLTTGTLGAGAITGTSFTIGDNTLATTEWAFLDGLDQALKTTDDVDFNSIMTAGYGRFDSGVGVGKDPTQAIDVVGRVYATDLIYANLASATSGVKTMMATRGSSTGNIRWTINNIHATLGDIALSFLLSDTTYWTVGVDRDDTRAFVIGTSATVGINPAIKITRATRDVDIPNDLTAGTIQADDGFTGTGAYTNFTIVGGIITAAN